MKRPTTPTIAALACALLAGLLYASPALKIVARTGLDWPIWLDHADGTTLTTYGKWWVLPPHHYLSDGSSGDFPVYVYYLSDALLNLLAEWFRLPAVTMQAVFYGPLLGALFLLLNYASLRPILRDAWSALGASVLLSFGGNSTFVDRLDPVSGLPLNTVLHVPFQVISLGTAQSPGWVLLLPCLSLTHLAYRRASPRLAIASGLLLGLLFHVHTLTFVNAAAAQLAYLILANAVELPRGRGYWAWLLALGVTAAGFVVLVAWSSRNSFGIVVTLGAAALATTFLVDRCKSFYIWSYGTAGLVALPYLLRLAPQAREVAAVQEGWASVQMMAVGLPGFLLFFAAYIVGAVLAYALCREKEVLVWTSALLLATGFLALNQYWHWYNHPYRFAIHLLFPLAVLTAVGVRRSPRLVGMALGLWLAAVCLWDVAGFAAGRRTFVILKSADPERAAFLRAVRDETRKHEGSGLHVLAPVEFSFPRGLVQATLLMNYSRVPAFVPDYRHVLWRERYYNRIGLLCFLFPGYPNSDYPLNRRACEEDLAPDPSLVEIRDLRLKTAILPVYGIGLAGGPGKPFSGFVERAAASYGWPVLAHDETSALVRTETASPPGVARVVSAASSAGVLSIRLEVERSGPHVLVLGGRRLADRAPVIGLDGRALGGCRRAANWAVCDPEIAAGDHRLELPSRDSGSEPEADYLYFVAVVHRDQAALYLSLPQPPVDQK